MKTNAPIPTGNSPKCGKTFLGSNVQTFKHIAANGCLVEDVVLEDKRDLATVAFTQENIDSILSRSRR